MIVIRMKRADGPGVTLRIDDDTQLQKVMDLANRHFGDPHKVLPDPVLVLAEAKARKTKKGKK